jgi:nickel-dependent lactate racemase
MKHIELLTAAWYKDIAYRIFLPDSWEHVVIGDQVIKTLPVWKIQDKIFDPIGSPQLSQLIERHSRILIIVDDLTRPTPLSDIMKVLREIFETASIPDEAINILVASGAHESMQPEDIIKKIGMEAYSRYKIHLHNGKHDLIHLGVTSRGTPIFINRLVMECDLIIGLGCLYPHPAAGFSGGAKILVPGAAGQDTIHYMHEHLSPEGERAGGLNSEFRREIEDIAARIGLDYIINVALNQYREIAGVFAGDPISAHRKGVEFIRDNYSVQPVQDADIVIADMYPFDVDLQFAYDRGFWPLLGAKKYLRK